MKKSITLGSKFGFFVNESISDINTSDKDARPSDKDTYQNEQIYIDITV